jgi:hypothetical protein
LQEENEQLKDALTAELRECARVLTEHRAEERDRDFKMTTAVQLEGVHTRKRVEEICRP